MSFQTDFSKQFEFTMARARIMMETKEYYKLRNSVLEGYMKSSLSSLNDNICARNIDGVYELIKEYFSNDKLSDYCLTVLFRGKEANSTIYRQQITELAIKKLGRYVRERDILSAKIKDAREYLNKNSAEYQDASKLLEKAQSPKIREMLSKMIEEYERPINDLDEELRLLNKSMYETLFGKDSINSSDQACLDMFIERYLPSKGMKK